MVGSWLNPNTEVGVDKRRARRKNIAIMSKHFDYLIVGSGLSGATFARLALDDGKSVLVVEKRSSLGGNIATSDVMGIPVHLYGPHIFHTDSKEAYDFFTSHVETYPFINSPLAFYKGKYYHMPFNMNTFSELWGVKTPEEAKAKIDSEVAKEGIKEPRNLEEQALSLVGRTIFETLVKGYTEKQWGRDCRDLPASIIKRLPLRFTYNNNYFNDPYQCLPKGGYSKLINNLLKGAEVRLGVDYLAHKAELRSLADKVIYTGALDEYFAYSLGELEWRSLRFETAVLPINSFQNNPVVNYTDKEPSYTRVCEHKMFDEELKPLPYTVVTYEYPDSFARGKIPYYPINDERNSELAKRYQSLAAKEEGVYFLGRLANYAYFDMDDTILKAMALYKEIGGC